jgi:hypothetical protein
VGSQPAHKPEEHKDSRIQTWWLMMRNFSGKALGTAASRMYHPSISVVVPTAAYAVASRIFTTLHNLHAPLGLATRDVWGFPGRQ